MNLANSQEIRIWELSQKIKQLTGSVSSLTFHLLPEDEPRRRCPDVNKAERLLGLEPVVELEQGLQRTIKWFRVESGA